MLTQLWYKNEKNRAIHSNICLLQNKSNQEVCFSFHFSEDVNPVNKFLFVLFFSRSKQTVYQEFNLFQKKIETNLSELCSQAII